MLLRSLSPETLKVFKSYLQPVDLPLRFKLGEPGRDCHWIYFPDSGVASVLGKVGTNWQEIGVFGQDGAGCLFSLLGARKMPYLIVMQVPGAGVRAPAAAVAELFQEREEVRTVFLRYVVAFMIQTAQSAIANVQYNTVQRMAHWFLMIHDRVDGDSILLTHEYIARMLGVGRTGVTLALHALEEAGTISTARKRITILDRARLETMTASVYGVAEAEYRRLIGSVPLSHSALHGPPGPNGATAPRQGQIT